MIETLSRWAADRPLTLLLEDLHWADEGTLSLLSFLARSVAKLPILLLVTYRDDEIEAGGLLANTLNEMVRLHPVQRLNLRGLPEVAVAEMIEVLGGHKPRMSNWDESKDRSAQRLHKGGRAVLGSTESEAGSRAQLYSRASSRKWTRIENLADKPKQTRKTAAAAQAQASNKQHGKTPTGKASQTSKMETLKALKQFEPLALLLNLVD